MSPEPKSALDQIKENTVIVADTGSFEMIKQFRPTDVTTNPSLILSAAMSAEYVHLVDEAIAYARSHAKLLDEQVDVAMDKLFVLCGKEMLKMVPGRVSTEIDARLSFDIEGQVKKAHHLLSLYAEEGIAKERVLIKLSSTWEGIKAGEILERDHGVHCNMTLLFNMTQAIACAEANATLISPFVGRIYDWYLIHTDKKSFSMLEDPGVVNVTKIYNYYKKYGYKTAVMGASFRTVDQIKGLSGCDLLTIGPTLLGQLSRDYSQVEVHLKADKSQLIEPKPEHKLNEKTFRLQMNDDPMATDRLADGIRRFSADARKLEALLREKLSKV